MRTFPQAARLLRRPFGREAPAQAGDSSASAPAKAPASGTSWTVLLALSAAGAFTSALLVSVLPLFLFAKGISISHVAGLFSLLSLAGVVVALAAGRHAVALGRPAALLGLLGAQVAVFPAYLLVGGPSSLLLLSTFSTVVGAAAGPALQRLVAQSTTPAQRSLAYAKLGATTSVSYGLGLVAASTLLAFGFHAVFLAGGLAALAAWLLAGALLAAQRAHRHPARQAVGLACASLEGRVVRLRDSLEGARPEPQPSPSRRNGRRMALHTLLFSTGLGAYPVYLPFLLLSLGLGLHWVGLAMASSWLVYGLVQPLAGRLVGRIGRLQQVVQWSLVAVAALNAGLAVAPLWGILAAWAALGVADGIGRPLTSAWLAQATAPQDWGRTMGLNLAATTLARTLTPALFALLILEQGIRSAFLATAALTLLSLWPLRRLASLPAEVPARAPAAAPVAGGPA